MSRQKVCQGSWFLYYVKAARTGVVAFVATAATVGPYVYVRGFEQVFDDFTAWRYGTDWKEKAAEAACKQMSAKQEPAELYNYETCMRKHAEERRLLDVPMDYSI